jgi:hypothetical protein
MAKYVKNANGYHTIVGETTVQNLPAYQTECGVPIVKGSETIESASPPGPRCKLCNASPEVKQAVAKAIHARNSRNARIG